MFVSIDVIAEQLDITHVSIWRWAKEAGLVSKRQKRGQGRQKIPYRAFINFLVEQKKVPFAHVERGAYMEKRPGRSPDVKDSKSVTVM